MRKIVIIGVWFSMAFVTAPNVMFAADYTMIMTNEVSSTHWKTGLMEEFAGMVEERSLGRIEVKVFSGGQLFTDKAAIMALGRTRQWSGSKPGPHMA